MHKSILSIIFLFSSVVLAKQQQNSFTFYQCVVEIQNLEKFNRSEIMLHSIVDNIVITNIQADDVKYWITNTDSVLKNERNLAGWYLNNKTSTLVIGFSHDVTCQYLIITLSLPNNNNTNHIQNILMYNNEVLLEDFVFKTILIE